MSDTSFDNRAIEIETVLAADTSVQSHCRVLPQAFVLPAGNSTDQTFVIVWPYLEASSLTQLAVWQICRAVVKLTYENGLLVSHKGIEVVPSVLDANNNTDRIARLSVHRHACEYFVHLAMKSALAAERPEDYWWTWYRRREGMPER